MGDVVLCDVGWYDVEEVGVLVCCVWCVDCGCCVDVYVIVDCVFVG